MKNTVRITRLKPETETNTVVLPGSYSKDGKIIGLKEDGEYKSYAFDDKAMPFFRDYIFGKNFTKLEYTYETEEAKQTPRDKVIEATVKVFWGNHPHLIVNGIAHKASSSPMFNIVDLRDKTVEEVKKFKDVLNAANKIVAMTTDERRSVAYYYGISPEGKTDGELLLKLGSFEEGICVNKFVASEFLKIWGVESNTDRDLTVVIKKAIGFGVITNNVIEGRPNYYLGSELIGTTENDIISYCKNNEKTYQEFIVRSVAEKDKFKEEEKATTKENKFVAGAPSKSFTMNEVAELRQEAKRLKTEGFLDRNINHEILSASKLLVEVEKAREAKEAKRKQELENV